MEPMDPMKPMGDASAELKRIKAETKAALNPPGNAKPPKVKRSAGDLHPKFKIGTLLGVLGILAVAVTNSLAHLGIEPQGFVAMVLALAVSLGGVYGATGDGR